MSNRNRDLDDEIRAHLQMAAADQGEDAARREFGSVALAKERTRDTWRFASLDRWIQDVRYGLRLLRRNPGFSLAAAVSLALGIGANTVTFSAMNALMLRTLPVPEADRLVMLAERAGSSAAVEAFASYRRFETYRRDLAKAFDGISVVALTDRHNVLIPGSADPGLTRVSLVSGNYFSMMRVGAAAGRTLTPDDDLKPGAHPVAVVSWAFAKRQFGGAAAAVARKITLNGIVYDIVGAAARDFAGDWVGRPADVWIPAMMQSQVMVEMPNLLTRGNPWMRIAGRLAPGVSREQAEALARIVDERDKADRIGPNPDPETVALFKSLRLEVHPASHGYSPARDSYGQLLTIILCGAGLILALACTNVATLLLTRSISRDREMSVRVALGAPRMRIARQLLTESVLLAVLGGGLGLLFTMWIAGALSRNIALGPAQLDTRAPSPWLSLDLHPDPLVFALTAALCIATGILFGLAPAVRASRTSLAPALSSRGAVGSASTGRLGKTLVIAQVAISLVLVTAAGLFVRTLRNLRTRDLGFDRQHLLMAWTSPGQTGRQGPKLVDFWRTVQERVESMPGVISAGASNQGLLNGWEASTNGGYLEIQGQPRRYSNLPSAWRSFVTPRFFASTGLQLIAGRDFTERDHETASRAIIINESTAKTYFPNQDPIGQRIAESAGADPWAEIVGVVKDMAAGSPKTTALSLTYLPYRQFGRAMDRMCIFVRTTGNPASFIPALRDELRKIDPALPVFKIDTVEEQLDDVLLQERVTATLGGAFSALAVTLACVGLYGVISYGAARRANEIGIRLALGAGRGNVLRTVVGQGVALGIAGVAVGVPAALAACRMIAAKLFGVGAADAWTIATASLLMIAVAGLAAFLPAVRAANVDPVTALRCE